jgi:hypothetical protein
MVCLHAFAGRVLRGRKGYVIKRLMSAVGAFLGLVCSTGAAHAGYASIPSGYMLFPGQNMVAPGCYYRLSMQTDGNLVVYGGNTARWAANTWGSSDAYASLQDDGNFVVYDGNGSARWSTGTGGRGRVYLYMQTDGNLVLRNSSAAVFWASRSNGPSDIGQTCAYTNEATYVESNLRQSFSNDYASFRFTPRRADQGFSVCGARCAQDEACSSWTYQPPSSGSTTARCFYYRATEGTATAAGYVTGWKETPQLR